MTVASRASPLPSDATTSATAPRLRGRWLVAARLAWVAVVLGVVAFYADTLPSYYAYLRVVVPAAACFGCGRLNPPDVHTLHQLGLSVDAYAGFVIATKVLILLGFGAVAAVLFWRASADRVALLTSFVLILLPQQVYWPAGGPIPALPLVPTLLLGVALAFLGWVCLGLFLCVFPSGRFVPRWTPWLLLPWTALGAVTSLPGPALPAAEAWLQRNITIVGPAAFAVEAAVFIGLVGAQVYRYRRVSTPAQRQQTKWAVLGAALGLGGYIAAFLVFVVLTTVVLPNRLARDLGYVAGTLLTLLLPLGIGIALLRYRLFDVDVLIRRTLLYGALTAVLAGLYAGAIVGLQAALGAVDRRASGSPVIVVATTLLIAAVFTPLRRGLQALIDRRFYRARYDAARTIEAFGATLRTETDLETLRARLLAVVDKTMQPEHAALWLRTPARKLEAPHARTAEQTIRDAP